MSLAGCRYYNSGKTFILATGVTTSICGKRLPFFTGFLATLCVCKVAKTRVVDVQTIATDLATMELVFHESH